MCIFMSLGELDVECVSARDDAVGAALLLVTQPGLMSTRAEDVFQRPFPGIEADAACFRIDAWGQLDLYIEFGFGRTLAQQSHGVPNAALGELNHGDQLLGLAGRRRFLLHMHALGVDGDGGFVRLGFDKAEAATILVRDESNMTDVGAVADCFPGFEARRIAGLPILSNELDFYLLGELVGDADVTRITGIA